MASVCPAGATSFLPFAIPLIIRKAALKEEWVVECQEHVSIQNETIMDTPLVSFQFPGNVALMSFQI